jgi:uncharacterized membrane protein
MIAIVRPSDWETPLFLHVGGAMLLVAGLFLVSTSLVLAWRANEQGDVAALTRLAYRTLFILVLPAYIAMRIGAQWILDRSGFDDNSTWVGIGFATSDIGALLIVICLVIAGVALRRADAGRGRLAAQIVTVVTLLLLAAYLVTVWAMTAKPT